MAAQNNDVIAATVVHDNDIFGERMNRYQFRVVAGGPIADADLLDDMAAVIYAIYNAVKAVISVRNVFREVNVINVTQDLLVGATDALGYNGGTSADPASPPACSLYWGFKTSVPRVALAKYLPSPAEGDIAATGQITGTTLGILALGAGILMDPFEEINGTYEYGHWSPKVSAWVAPTLAVVPVEVAYQRRRKKGIGS